MIRLITIRVLGIRNQVAYVTHKDPGYVNLTLNHVIRVPAGHTQLMDPRFLITEKHHLHATMKARFFA